MRSPPYQRRREAGLALLEACEQTLSVSGPTALAELTGRSKSWWSKLAAGTAPFPTWMELLALLPAEVPEPEREKLHGLYRRIWLQLYDPELLERLDSPVPVQPHLDDLQFLQSTAGVIGYVQGDQRTALRLQGIVETLLVARGMETLSRQELMILRECLEHQSVWEGDLGNYPSSIAIARRSVAYQRAGGDRLSELLARHTLGLALHKADLRPRGDYLARAAGEFAALEREYERLGMTHEVIRARRDRAVTLIYLGRPTEGEAELVRAHEVPRQSGEDQFLTLMWLAETALGRQDVPQARRWLAMMRVVARRNPEEVPRLLRFQFVAQRVTTLQHAVASLPTRRNR